MIKKMLIATISFLIVLMPKNVMAEEIKQKQLETANVRLYANVNPSYTIRIPKEIILNDHSSTYELSIKGNLKEENEIQIQVPNKISIFNDEENKNNQNTYSIITSTNLLTSKSVKTEYSNDSKVQLTLLNENENNDTKKVILPLKIRVLERGIE